MFVIRDVSLDDADNFRFSSTMLEVAERQGLWAKGQAFDFTKIFSYGEARHKYYSGRRLWRALSLFNASLQLPTEYDDLVMDPAYPFSVVPDRLLGWRDLSAVMRDTFEATHLDLGRGLAAGPFGVVDRYDSDPSQHGAFERPIGTYRMAYSYIGEVVGSQRESTDGREGGSDEVIVWFGPHASVTNVYLPVFASMAHAPRSLSTGSVKTVDRASAYWAFRYVKQLSLGHFSMSLPLIRARQKKWEEAGEKIVRQICTDWEKSSPEETTAALESLATHCVQDWWQLADELVLRYGDGWEWGWGNDAASAEPKEPPAPQPLSYDATWLDMVGYATSCSERAAEWPVAAKIEAFNKL